MSRYHIVVGVDGSDHSIRALRWAAHDAQTRGGTIQAIMAFDWAGNEAALLVGPGPEGERRHAEEVLDQAVAGVRRAYGDVPIATEVRLGNPARTLTEAARGASLLVVGSHGHGRLHHAVLGSVSEDCIRLAPCPVVVVPSPHLQPERHSPPGPT